jgi:hypothetical protein
MNTQKIGELNYKEYRTEIVATTKTIAFLEDHKISTASLIPNAWQFYEVMLFEMLEDRTISDKHFVLVYDGILERFITKGKKTEKIYAIKPQYTHEKALSEEMFEKHKSNKDGKEFMTTSYLYRKSNSSF